MLKSLAITDFMPPDTHWPDVPTMVMELGDDCTALASCGDGQLLAILHLDAHSLTSALKNNTLFARVGKLKSRSAWAYLIISGGIVPNNDGYARIGGHATKWRWDALQGALATVQELGVVVIHIAAEASVGPTIERLAKRERGPKRERSLRDFDTISPAEDMLLCIPGIGPQTMLSLFNETSGSLIWALIALTAPDVTVPGVNATVKAAARAVLGLRDDENLCLISPGDTIVSASLETQKVAA